MFKLRNLTYLLLISLALVIGCSSGGSTKDYTEKNQPNFNSLSGDFDKISKLGLSYDMSIKHLDQFLLISKEISKKLPKAIEDRNATKTNKEIENSDNNYSLLLKDTQTLVSEQSISKMIILKNYLVVTDKIEALDLNGASKDKLIKIEESLRNTWSDIDKKIKQLNTQNKDVKTALNFTNNIIKDLDDNITALKANKEPALSLGAINNKAIEHISSLKENIKRNEIVTITYLQGLIKTIDAQWSSLPIK